MENRVGKYNMVNIVKFVCSILVIAIHTSAFLSLGEVANATVSLVIARIAVPFFFIASGYFFYMKMESRDGYLKGYIKKLAIIYGLFTMIHIFILSRILIPKINGIFGFLKAIYANGFSPSLWYFPALILSVSFVYVFLKKGWIKPLVIVSIVLFSIGLMGDSYFGLIKGTPLENVVNGYNFIFDFTRNGLAFGVPFLTIGALINKYRLDEKVKNPIIFIGVFSIVFALESYVLISNKIPFDYNMYISLVLLVPFIFIGALRSKVIISDRASKLLGDMSLWIYCVHELVLFGFVGYIHVFRSNTLTSFITVTVISIGIAYLISSKNIKSKLFEKSEIFINGHMTSYNMFVIRYIKNEKRSVIPIFISIILTISSITSVIFITQNINKNNFDKEKSVYGDYDIRLQKINNERLDKINKYENIKDYALGRNNEILVNKYKNENEENRNISYFSVYGVEQKFFDEYIDFNVVEGRLPERENEIILSKYMIDALNSSMKDFNYEERYGVGTIMQGGIRELRGKNNYGESFTEVVGKTINMRVIEEWNTIGDWNEIDREIQELVNPEIKIENDRESAYTIVGIIEVEPENTLFLNKVIRLLNEDEIENKSNEFEAFTYLNDPSKEEEIANDLGLKYITPNKNMESPFGYEAADVKYVGYGKGEYESVIINQVSLTIIGIIIAFCFMAVYNTFHASVAKRIKTYGILRATGATSGQIRYLIYAETLILYVLAVPIGLLFGYGITKLESYILVNKMGLIENFVMDFNLEVILITLISTLAIIETVVRNVLKKGSKLTPIEAIMDARGLGREKKSLGKNVLGQSLSVNGNGEEDEEFIKEIISYEKTTLKYKIIKKVFKYEGELAHKNITRDAKAHNLTKSTLLIAMAMLIFFFLQIVNGKVKTKDISKSDKWDVKLELNGKDFDNEVVKNIRDITGVEGIYKTSQKNVSLVVPNNVLSEELEEIKISLNMANNRDKKEYNTKDSQGITGSIMTLDEESIKLYNGLNKEALDNGGVVLVSKGSNYIEKPIGDGETFYQYKHSEVMLNYKTSDKILLSEDESVLTEEGLENYYNDNREFKELNIVETVDDDILYSNFKSTNINELDYNVKLLTTEEGLKKIICDNLNNKILIKTKNNQYREDIITELEKISNENDYEIKDNLGDKLRLERRIKEELGLNIIFAVSILIMVILNLINTINASILSRRKELAGMRAIGMSKSQQNKMIVGELFYISLTVAISIILSVGLLSIGTQGLNIRGGKVNVGMLILGEGIIIIFLMIVANLTALVPLLKVSKFSIVEDLKED